MSLVQKTFQFSLQHIFKNKNWLRNVKLSDEIRSLWEFSDSIDVLNDVVGFVSFTLLKCDFYKFMGWCKDSRGNNL